MNEANDIEKTTKDHAQTVAIVTDSVAQIPAEIARQLDIMVIPFTVNINGRSYLDGTDLAPTELYRRMRMETIVPTTAGPSLGQYQEVFRVRLQAGAQAVLCVVLSKNLSSSYNIACLAAKQVLADFPECAIEVLDSQKATIAQGFIAIAAARAAAEGKSLAEVLQVAREVMPHTGIAATLETLEYLERGGRIGKAAYMLGSLIDIKPVLTIDEQGKVSPIRKVRGENRALQAIVDQVQQLVNGSQHIYLAILEADAPERAARLEELVLQKLQPLKIFHSELTPVMGVHTGPGVIGLAYYYE
jgi:DegV family protein with EDD domain